MFLIVLHIASRLQQVAHFQSWDVRHNLEAVSRQVQPAVDVRMVQAAVPGSDECHVRVAPALAVSLIVKAGPTAARELDAAFRAACRALQGHAVRCDGGPTWAPLKLAQVREVPQPEGSLVGCELIFTTDAEFDGQQCDC